MVKDATWQSLHWKILRIYEPVHDKTYNKTCVTSNDSDQPEHSPSMSRVHVHLSLDSPEAAEGTCDHWRLWSDCANVKVWLRWGLLTHQPLWVILCCRPEKGRRELEEKVEEIKERDRAERKMNVREETEEIKILPLYPYLLQEQQALPNCKPIISWMLQWCKIQDTLKLICLDWSHKSYCRFCSALSQVLL